MTNVKIVYNPADLSVRIFYESKEVISSENKVYAFLKNMGLYNSLFPFQRRYVIWRGLLAELINEFNDDELHILFEGREKDFQEVEKAFENTKSMVEDIGYDNNWHLSFIRNFDIENLVEELKGIAEEIRQISETREELHEVGRLLVEIRQDNFVDSLHELEDILDKHIEKWGSSNEKYKKSKVDLLMMKKTAMQKLQRYSQCME
mgnify:CR=1 FL=1